MSSEDEGKAPRPRMVYVAINSDVVDNKCYIPTEKCLLPKLPHLGYKLD